MDGGAARSPTWGDGTPAAPIASAAVLLLRDGRHGLEVLLIQRHELSDVLGGAHTFPGGKVDAGDLAAQAGVDVEPALLRDALDEPQLTPAQGAALYVAALRELQEEAGIAGLAASQLVPWSRWITPAASRRARKHFDARFFAALAPAGQEAAHDCREAVASAWFTPADALREFAAGRMQLAPPQLMSLLQLAAHRTADDALCAARARRPPAIQPAALEVDGRSCVCFPGDPQHPVAAPVLSGPTRLVWANGRFEFDVAADPARRTEGPA